ncbi:Aurkb, partial [Symbiodinium sp. CCMP2456]
VSRPKKTPKVMTVEDLVDSGKIPEESAERYEALSGAEISELQEMAESLELPSDGTPQQLAFRIVRCLAGLPPASDAALGKTPKAPARKAAAAKPKLRAG